MKYDYYITGTIGEAYDWWTGQKGTTANMVKNFLVEHKDREVTIAVSSFGGYLDEGIAIMEYIKDHGKCNMVIIGMTASAATILCMKAKSVKIARGSMMLIHNSSQMLDVWTSANKEKIDEIIRQFQHEREQLDTIDKCIADIYSAKNGKSIEDNLQMMGKEKWLSAEDALSFGLVDGVLDDEDDAKKAKTVKNVYTRLAGVNAHYGLPDFENEDKPSQGIFQRVREALRNLSCIMNDVESSNININNQTTIKTMNKTFVTVNALLKVEGLNESADGIVMTTENLQVIEDNLVQLQGKVENLGNLESQLAQAKTEKQTAESAKADAEQKLADLQKEFEKFKKEAGADTLQKPIVKATENGAAAAKSMYDSIKNLL